MVKIIQMNVGGFDNNYSYLVYGDSNQALLIDATGNKEEIEKQIAANDLVVVRQVVTHMHPDHIENVEYFEEKGIPIISYEELKFEKGFMIDNFLVRVLFTPGHTKDSVCFLVENNLFTGDTLFVKGVGTTLYGGNQTELEETLSSLRKLDGEITIWPGHNYGGESSTLKTALDNSHIKPSKKTHDLIHKKVKDYNEKADESFKEQK